MNDVALSVYDGTDPVVHCLIGGPLDSQYPELGSMETDKWYFWDATWTQAIGPYDTEDAARKGLEEYVEELS